MNQIVWTHFLTSREVADMKQRHFYPDSGRTVVLGLGRNSGLHSALDQCLCGSKNWFPAHVWVWLEIQYLGLRESTLDPLPLSRNWVTLCWPWINGWLVKVLPQTWLGQASRPQESESRISLNRWLDRYIWHHLYPFMKKLINCCFGKCLCLQIKLFKILQV